MASSIFTKRLLPLATPEAWRRQLGIPAVEPVAQLAQPSRAEFDALQARVAALEEASKRPANGNAE